MQPVATVFSNRQLNLIGWADQHLFDGVIVVETEGAEGAD
jgi:hypothetical protein